jgi:hypothetical protein
MRTSAGLGGRSYEDFVERNAARAANGKDDELGDIVGGDGGGLVEPLGRLLGLLLGDVVDELCSPRRLAR